ncbi:MAG: ferredoxin family protein [Thermoguttaceae bacterium]
MRDVQPLPDITVIISECRDGDDSCRLLDSRLIGLIADQFCHLKQVMVPYLYDLDPEGPAVSHLRSISGELVVLSWLNPRAAGWLLDANGIEGYAEDRRQLRAITCVDLRRHDSADSVVEDLHSLLDAGEDNPDAGTPEVRAPVRVEEVTRRRWYPVIDFDRCENCLECLDFCLFGVFDLDESGRIAVLDADACRDGCPACARVCPSQAIMFPHHDNRAVAGDVAAGPGAMGPELLQLSPLTDAGQLADTQRNRALAEKDELDKLVDELDEMDL